MADHIELSVAKPMWLEITQIGSSIILILFTLLSALLLGIPYLQRKFGSSRVKLPDDTFSAAHLRKGVFSATLLSHLDTEHKENRHPVNTTAFWKSVIYKRWIVLALCLTNLGFQIANLILHKESHLSNTAWTVLKLVSEFLSTTHLVIASSTYVLTQSVPAHSSLTQHICGISAMSFLHWYVSTLGQYLAINYYITVHWTEFASFATITAVFIQSGLISLGPPLYQDLKELYNKAVTAKLEKETQDEDFSEADFKANLCEEVSASIFGRLSFAYVYPMIIKSSAANQIDIQDLPAPQEFFRTQNILRDSVKANDRSGLRSNFGPTISLLLTVWGPEWKNVLKGLGYMLLLCPLWYIPHICLQQILYVLDSPGDHRAAVAFAILLVLARAGNLVILLQQLNITSTFVNPRITAHSCYLLYQKIMTRNCYATPEAPKKGTDKTVHTKADILNLISSDTSALSRIGWTGVQLVSVTVEMILGSTYVWILLGPSGFVGLATLVLTLPPAYFITKLEYNIFEKRLAVKDEKISLMQEAVQAISMIKMMAAERFWFGRINEVRDREFKRLTQARLLGFISGFLYAITPTLIVIVAFAHYTLVAKKQLTATIAFTSIAVFDELRPVLTNLPTSFAQLLQEILSAKRIGQFLDARDVDYLLEPPTNGEAVPEADKLYIHGTVTWDVPPANPDPESVNVVNPVFKLRDVDINFPRGTLTLVAGKFGSGKSLLLLALLGEARLLDGKISYLISPLMNPKVAKIPDWSLIRAGVAFVPQTPWLQSQSIRDNILFGLPMDLERYRAVIFSVGLMPDLEILDDADLTEIGERGKILSGGQKARVSLARAVYSRASVLLLDDVISAVDAETSKHIVEHCFSSPLMADRTIIIASHAVEALAPLAGHSVFLDDGKAVWTGTGPELLESEHMNHLKTESHKMSEPEPEPEAIKERRQSVNKDTNLDFGLKEAVPKTPKQLIIEEQRAKGAVELHHWRDLKRFNGATFFWSLLITMLLLAALAPVAERKVLELWTHGAKTILDPKDIMFWVILYSALAVGAVLFDTAFGLCRFYGGLRAAKRIHSQMLESVLRAKMVFFSKTRAGSIIQRFGEDLNDVLECSELFGSLGEGALHIFVNILTVTVTGGWPFGVVTCILLVAIWKPGQWYRSASRQVRRLEAIIPGPINAIYGETVAGTAVIRAFGVQSIFVEDLVRNLNMKINVRAWTIYIGRWLFISLRGLDLIVVSTALFLILTRPGISGAAAGFILVFAGAITWNVNWMLINLRQFELKGVSLERTSEYRLLEKEDGQVLNPHGEGYISDDETQTTSWPTHGSIQVKNLQASYGPDLPNILHGVSFDVQGGQRVGIVGATGGGKSTLAKAFFSFVDVTGGKIEIDGKDIADIPLGQVRSNLGIIAQDPILLSGSLRLNLDLDSKYSDEQLYDALRQVQLLKRVDSDASSSASSSVTVVGEEAAQQNIFSNLDSEIKSGGENLSAGQKQLVVLARALLKQQKILILDEATASIDSATDAEISRVVHEEFIGVTVLIIAHRLRTIMPCSKILVMDKGNLVQQGSPAQLIKEDGGKFQTLCKAAGMEEYNHLVSLAEKYSGKNDKGLLD